MRERIPGTAETVPDRNADGKTVRIRHRRADGFFESCRFEKSLIVTNFPEGATCAFFLSFRQ